VQFRFAVRELNIAASVHAPVPIDPATLEIGRIDHEGRREVRIVRRSALADAETISDDLYAANLL
jgi:hypothetical protein